MTGWPTIVTSRLPSSPAACFCPSGSHPFPLDFLLWGPFGHAATQVKFKPPRSKSASFPPPSLPKIFGKKKHFRKTDCFDKERAREKTRFSVQKKHQTKRHKKHVLNDRPAEAGLQHSWRYTRDEAFKVWSENCEPPMCTNWVGAVYDRLPPSSQASSAWTSTSPPPPWLSPPPPLPEEVLKDILDELTGVQGRVNKIEMMIIKLLNQKNESKETIKHC